MASELTDKKKEHPVTLGHAKDRIVALTQILARKEYQILFVSKEKDFYKRAFKETHDQNSQIRKELHQFQSRLVFQLGDSHILTSLQSELSSQIKTIKEVSKQMIDALSFYKDLNSLVSEREFDDADVLCAHLNAFLAEWATKMQTEVLQTDKLETRLEYLENELGKIKEMREKFEIPDCNLIYKKQLQIDIDGEVEEIGASIMRD